MGVTKEKTKCTAGKVPTQPKCLTCPSGHACANGVATIDGKEVGQATTVPAGTTGGSLKVLTTECEDASRECTLCPTSVSVLPRPQSTCYQLVSEKFLYTTSRNSKFS